MENRSQAISEEQQHGMKRKRRDLPPSHYLFKIKSFSLLVEEEMEEYISDVFEACGHQWRLILHPNGSDKDNFISLYLEIDDSEFFSFNWEVHVEYKLFIFDQIRHKYIAIKDDDVRFCEMKIDHGSSKFLSQEAFKNTDNGYLIDDCCIFGAEVFVIEHPPRMGQLSMIQNPTSGTITWKIDNFSKLDRIEYYSPVKSVGGVKWHLLVYPKGDNNAKGTHLSVYLGLAEPHALPPKRELYVTSKLQLKDHIKSTYFDEIGEYWFTSVDSILGYSDFILLKDLHDQSNGYLVNDTLIVEAEFIVISEVKSFDFKYDGPTMSKTGKTGMTRTLRNVPPSHFLFKINSFSLLVEEKIQIYEFVVFQAGDYKWRLVLYPTGDKESNGKGYISLYLEIVETEYLSSNWEVYVDFKLFVFDQIRDQYLSVKDTEVPIRRFHEMKTKWGFPQFLSQKTFNNVANGYLVDDCCTFGAEIFVVERTLNLQKSFITKPCARTFTWKIENLSKLDQECYKFPIDSVQGIEWSISVYPEGYGEGKGTHLSVYLELAEPDSLSPDRDILVKSKLQLRDQIKSNHFEKIGTYRFSSSEIAGGVAEFVALKDLYDSLKGYIVNDTIIVEADIIILISNDHN